MADYHVGAGLFGIYAGTLNPKGDTWRNKTEVTREALGASAQYLLENEKEFRFQRASDEKWYVMRVLELPKEKKHGDTISCDNTEEGEKV